MQSLKKASKLKMTSKVNLHHSQRANWTRFSDQVLQSHWERWKVRKMLQKPSLNVVDLSTQKDLHLTVQNADADFKPHRSTQATLMTNWGTKLRKMLTYTTSSTLSGSSSLLSRLIEASISPKKSCMQLWETQLSKTQRIDCSTFGKTTNSLSKQTVSTRQLSFSEGWPERFL